MGNQHTKSSEESQKDLPKELPEESQKDLPKELPEESQKECVRRIVYERIDYMKKRMILNKNIYDKQEVIYCLEYLFMTARINSVNMQELVAHSKPLIDFAKEHGIMFAVKV